MVISPSSLHFECRDSIFGGKVVSEEREELARSQLAAFRAVTLVLQPSNLGTGPGILLPLTRVLAADRHAQVVVLPSDQFVRDEAPFRQSVRQASARAYTHDGLVLIGAVPDIPDPQYGWIGLASARSTSACQRRTSRGTSWSTRLGWRSSRSASAAGLTGARPSAWWPACAALASSHASNAA